jgi:hypothetical protein
MGKSILVERYSTVNTTVVRVFRSFKKKGRGCDGSHSRADRQVSRCGFQAGELAGDRQGKRNSAPSVAKELPLCSFDGYYNFVGSDQIQTTARSRFDGARVNVELFNLLAKRIVSAPQSLDVRLHMHELLRRHRHPSLRPRDHGNANRRGGENDHAKNDPRGNNASTAADLGRRANDVD